MRNPTVLFAVFVVLCVLPACRSDETCTNLRKTHEDTLARQTTALLPTPDLQGPVLIVSQVREDVLLEPISLALKKQGPIRHTVSSKLPAKSKASANLVLSDVGFALSPKCTDCVQWSSKLNTNISVKALGSTLYSGTIKGSVAGLVPVGVEPSKGGKGSTRAIAKLSKASLTRVDLQLGDLPKSLRPTISDLIRKNAPTLLKRFGKDIEVATWDAVELPDTGVRVQVKGFQTSAVHKTLRVDWVTNLKAREGETLEALTTVPPLTNDQERASITVSAQLLTTLSQAAMRAGLVPNRFNTSFKPSKKGEIFLAIRNVEPKKGGLDTTITAWNLPTKGDACYSATMKADTTFALRNRPTKSRGGKSTTLRRDIRVSLNDLKLLSTDGDDTLFKLGMWVKSDILEESISAQTSVLGSMTVPLAKRSKLDLTVERIDSQPTGLTIFLKPTLQVPNLTPKPTLRTTPGALKPHPRVLRPPSPKPKAP